MATETSDRQTEPEPLLRGATATYSVEDNKLRLYADKRLDDETYERVKAAGFRWAPRQQLFVAPMWTPEREDLLLELCGGIEPEETSLEERAAMRAERFDELAQKRMSDSNAYARRAAEIGARFASGQPILVGHHSERSARRDQEKMERAQHAAARAVKLANYWAYRAEGSERHAARKADPAVRRNRIRTLLADLRSHQRKINFLSKAIRIWKKVDQDKDLERKQKAARYFSGVWGQDGRFSPDGVYDGLERGDITCQEAIDRSLEWLTDPDRSVRNQRWIAHILGRLGYEREELGPVERFEGELTAAILQDFFRTGGTEKPKAEKTESGWRVKSPAPMPAHLGDGNEMEMREDEWKNLMQDAGYEVPVRMTEKRRVLPPILNVRLPGGVRHKVYGTSSELLEQVEMTKAQYNAIPSDWRFIREEAGGRFRFRGAYLHGQLAEKLDRKNHSTAAVFLTDSKEHPMPE